MVVGGSRSTQKDPNMGRTCRFHTEMPLLIIVPLYKTRGLFVMPQKGSEKVKKKKMFKKCSKGSKETENS